MSSKAGDLPITHDACFYLSILSYKANAQDICVQPQVHNHRLFEMVRYTVLKIVYLETYLINLELCVSILELYVSILELNPVLQ